MIRRIDAFLNGITMYKVVLYGLLVLVAISFLLSTTHVLFYSPLQLFFSLVIVLSVSFATNIIGEKLYKAPVNVESWAITALILFFIMLPVASLKDALILGVTSVIAISSKFVFAIAKKHLFNPAAFGVFAIGLVGFGNALWWVGSEALLPFVALIGVFIVRKLRRFSLVLSFLAASVFSISLTSVVNNVTIPYALSQALTSWPLVFFATVMLTEPLTTPPTRRLQLLYGSFVGILFGMQFQIGPLYATPEFALLVGNFLFYIISPKQTVILHLKEKLHLGADIYEFIFTANKEFFFVPGQYLEWTLPHKHPDTRGNRRYFTIASSPTESDIRLGVKLVPQDGSTFKKTLGDMKTGDRIYASHVSGDFVLPRDTSKKLVFIAGGIGITPFRSIIKYLVDKQQKRDIVLLYAATSPHGFAYQELFEKAKELFSLKPIYILTNKEIAPKTWKGKTGYITEDMIKKEIPDYKERLFYLSGPNAMVHTYQSLLENLGVTKKSIVTDYFPGF